MSAFEKFFWAEGIIMGILAFFRAITSLGITRQNINTLPQIVVAEIGDTRDETQNNENRNENFEKNSESSEAQSSDNEIKELGTKIKGVFNGFLYN